MSGKVQYQCTMSLDGFIAGPDGDMSWLLDHLGPDPAADEIMRGTRALLVGNRTFGGGDPNEGTDREGAYGGQWSGPQFVLTHNPPPAPVPGVTFMDDLPKAVAAAREAAGDGDVGVLGADVARQCLEAGLLDEVVLFVAPVMLGDGTPLFRRVGGEPVQLERLEQSASPNATYLRYRVTS